MKLEVAFLERDEYIEYKEVFGGIQYIFSTGTGRKLSVIRHKFSYGNECEQGLYEMADITDGIVDNVQGYLTAERVIEILEEER
ncbi:hypothetical protein JL837_03410 [Staphylococcus pseudintermedius]|uniref:hypothetical protein n=1 Tax=Staphylococcus pseudintermedius TaxID=283734 RepID=UPI001D680C14|nr:hypothetical protein [Staphylococcus pseudintermedius]EHT3698254.1 hypothetical protein [Staphylococcus pseudintermedius]EHV5300884.1 hypothetical protein [Staphylococcus pseudintermedius]EJO7062320.1 hypothetical protein [Staphylococcus pseudintermedius]EJY6949461.1 hypothetical protein [Staphylococcus pseudintermedius]EJY6953810.1 hypothetical protein [Staphylococcus pseudintermedius]